ncbi:hypothetical protein D3C81_1460200 [compost metagenome]
MAKAEPAAGQADLAEHGGKRNGHPVRLLAAMLALHGKAAGDVATFTGELRGELFDADRADAGDGGGPGGCLWRAVAVSEQIGFQFGPAAAVRLQERLVVRIGAAQGVGQREHQRHVGVRSNRNPLGTEKVGAVVAGWTDIDDRGATGGQLAQPAFLRMLGRAAGGDLTVLECQSAKGDEDLGVRDQAGPRGHAAGQRTVGANHMGQQELRRAPAVVADLIDAAAAAEMKAADQ